MGIKEEINFYANNLTSIKKYRIYMTKIGILDKNIERYLKKEIKGNKNIQFTSQDLRELVVKLEKIHKAMNKSISFIEMENKYAKRGYIDEKTVKEDGRDLGLRIGHTIILQEQLARFNHHATLCFFIEYQYDKEKQNDDKFFNEEMVKILKDSY